LLVGKVGPLVCEFWFHRHGKPIGPGTWFLVTGAGRDLYRPVPLEGDMPKLPGVNAAEQGKGKPRKPTQMLKHLRELASFLTDFAYPDGTPIGNVQLAVRTRGPLVVAQLKLAGMGGLRMTVEETDVDAALIALEAALTADPQPWEPDPYPLDGGSKKRK